jgi:hypothetical protein
MQSHTPPPLVGGIPPGYCVKEFLKGDQMFKLIKDLFILLLGDGVVGSKRVGALAVNLNEIIGALSKLLKAIG